MEETKVNIKANSKGWGWLAFIRKKKDIRCGRRKGQKKDGRKKKKRAKITTMDEAENR